MARTTTGRDVPRLGWLATGAGVALSIAGATGSLDWIVQDGTGTGRLTNAAPGLILLFLGALVLWRTTARRPTNVDVVSSGGSPPRRDTGARLAADEPLGGGGPRSRLEVDSVRRLREEIEKARKDS